MKKRFRALINAIRPPSNSHIRLRRPLPLLWLIVLLVGAFLLPDRIWNTLLIGIGGMLLIALFWAWQLAHHVAATRQVRSGWVAVGDRLQEHFVLTNSGTLPAVWVAIDDASTVPGYRSGVVRSVGGNQVLRWRETAVCLFRGQYQLGPWSLKMGDPFGIFEVTVAYSDQTDIIIHPPIDNDLPIPLPSGQSHGRARSRDRAWNATNNAASVRSYNRSDPYRWIHWPTTARRGDLFVRQFDLDAAGDIWILVDMTAANQLGEGSESTEEVAVLLAASLAARAEMQQRQVGLVAYGRNPHLIPPGRGQGQQWRIMRTLALLHADGESSLAAALRDLGRVVGRGSALITITASGDGDWLPELLRLNQRGVQSSVILLDRASFGGDSNASLRPLLLQRGVDTFMVQQTDFADLLISAEDLPDEFIVTGTGKVVRAPQPELAPTVAKEPA